MVVRFGLCLSHPEVFSVNALVSAQVIVWSYVKISVCSCVGQENFKTFSKDSGRHVNTLLARLRSSRFFGSEDVCMFRVVFKSL